MIANPFDRNTIIHLRLIFSIFLLPVYIFAVSQTPDLNLFNALAIFFILHFLIYPASNLYNSYYDKDSRSIGGLRNPPPVSKNLYTASIMLDLAAILAGCVISPLFSFFLIPYIGASKLYSWNKTRLKKYAIAGWLTVIIFQGAYTFFLVSYFSSPSIHWWNAANVLAMLISSLFIGAYYPLTQIYQHEEDSERGDITISYKLGIKGTFVFTAILFAIAIICMYLYMEQIYPIESFYLFIILLSPALLYFFYWAQLTFRNPSNADFTHAMRMTWISSVCMSIAFLYLFFTRH